MLGGRVDKRLQGAARVRREPGRRLPGNPRWWLAGGAGVLVLAGVLTWAFWPGDERPDPRSRVYTEASACLLTPVRGVTDKAAAPVWAGMQQASLETRGKVSFLEVDGPQTGENAATYLATLVNGGCDLVLTAGDAPAAAVSSWAGQYPRVNFVAVGGADKKALANVVRVDEADDARITERVHSLVAQAMSTQES